MNKKLIISNATPIISLCSVGQESILKELFGNITIPKAVNDELIAVDKPGSNFSENNWVKVVDVKNRELVKSLQKDLDKGEAEVIALAKQLKADIVIIDESFGYQIAQYFNLPVLRTLSVLKAAKEKKIIDKIKPIVKDMVNKGRWYSPDLIKRYLKSIGE